MYEPDIYFDSGLAADAAIRVLGSIFKITVVRAQESAQYRVKCHFNSNFGREQRDAMKPQIRLVLMGIKAMENERSMAQER